jgi:hypothetical protein
MYDGALRNWIDTVSNSTVITDTSFGPINSTITDARAMIQFPAAVPINLLPLMLRSPEVRIRVRVSSISLLVRSFIFSLLH